MEPLIRPLQFYNVYVVRGTDLVLSTLLVTECEPLTRVSEMARWKISLARGIPCCPNFFLISFVRPTSLCCEEYMYIYTYLTAYRLYMNYRCYQITLQWNIFTQTLSGAKCLLDIYHCGAGLAVTGRMHDIGQNVLQSALPTGSSCSPQLLPHSVLIAFREEAFIRNMMQ